jgi:hypothetical protein
MSGGPFGPLPKKISIERLVTLSLCQVHNNALSPLDIAAIDVANALRELRSVREVRESRKWKAPGPAAYRIQVSAVLFERWAGKLVLSLEYVMGDRTSSWALPAWLPEFVFGQRALPNGAGLGFLADLNDEVDFSEHMKAQLGQRLRDTGPTSAIIGLLAGWISFSHGNYRSLTFGRYASTGGCMQVRRSHSDRSASRMRTSDTSL